MEKSNLTKWEVLDSESVIDSRYLKIRRDTVRLPDGTIYNEFYVNERIGWAAIFCITIDGKVLLTRQYKHGIGEVVLELPAGSIEFDDASPEEGIRRELEEETGYRADTVELLGQFIIDPTSSTGRVWVYLARNGQLTGRKKEDDAREIIQLELATPEEVLGKVRAGEIMVQGHVAAIYMVCDKLGLLEPK